MIIEHTCASPSLSQRCLSYHLYRFDTITDFCVPHFSYATPLPPKLKQDLNLILNEEAHVCSECRKRRNKVSSTDQGFQRGTVFVAPSCCVHFEVSNYNLPVQDHWHDRCTLSTATSYLSNGCATGIGLALFYRPGIHKTDM